MFERYKIDLCYIKHDRSIQQIRTLFADDSGDSERVEAAGYVSPVSGHPGVGAKHRHTVTHVLTQPRQHRVG